MISCPFKAAAYATESAAQKDANARCRSLGLPAGSLRVYLCRYRRRTMPHWHMTKARSYADWVNGPRHLRRWDFLAEWEIGKRAYACGRRENMGAASRRRAYIVSLGAGLERRREAKAA